MRWFKINLSFNDKISLKRPNKSLLMSVVLYLVLKQHNIKKKRLMIKHKSLQKKQNKRTRTLILMPRIIHYHNPSFYIERWSFWCVWKKKWRDDEMLLHVHIPLTTLFFFIWVNHPLILSPQYFTQQTPRPGLVSTPRHYEYILPEPTMIKKKSLK